MNEQKPQLSERQQRHLAGVSCKTGQEPSKYDDTIDHGLDMKRQNWERLYDLQQMRKELLTKKRVETKQVIVRGDYRSIKSMPPTYADAWKALSKYSYKNKMLVSICLEAGIAGKKALKYFNKEKLITITSIKSGKDKVIEIIGNKLGPKEWTGGKIVIHMPFKEHK